MERYDGELTQADRRLADVLLSDPQESSYLSAEALARRAGVHQSAASRLARKLGYDSYRGLRAALRKDLRAEEASADRIRKRLDHIGQKSILTGLVESEVRALTGALEQVEQATVEAAAVALRDAEDILIYGQGHATVLVELFERRLTRSGYRARGLRHSDWSAPDALLSLGAGDLVVAFSFRRPAAKLDKLLRHAAKVGATSLVISDQSGPTVRPRPDILLAASRGALGESQSLTVPMTICNALILELSRCDGGHSIRSLERLDSLRRDYAGAAAAVTGEKDRKARHKT